MINQTALESASKDGFLIGSEHFDALVLQFSDGTGTQIDNLLVLIRKLLVHDALQDAILVFLVEET